MCVNWGAYLYAYDEMLLKHIGRLVQVEQGGHVRQIGVGFIPKMAQYEVFSLTGSQPGRKSLSYNMACAAGCCVWILIT